METRNQAHETGYLLSNVAVVDVLRALQSAIADAGKEADAVRDFPDSVRYWEEYQSNLEGLVLYLSNHYAMVLKGTVKTWRW
jgi:hypothetical protein